MLEQVFGIDWSSSIGLDYPYSAIVEITLGLLLIFVFVQIIRRIKKTYYHIIRSSKQLPDPPSHLKRRK
jgi:NhaP-type Na+/H+ or K+/H+ antiporter